MSGRPTPETDDLARGNHVVPTEWAEQLERERDEALIDRANGDIATMTINHYKRILRERDEAREDLIKTYTKINDLEIEIRGVGLLCDKAKRERDEAREERDKLQAMRKEVVASNRGAKINAKVSNILAGKLNRAERERDESAAMLGRYKQERDIAEADAVNFHARIFELINERDILRLDAQREAEAHDRMVVELEKVYAERDEARESDATLERANQAERERDEAREELKKLEGAYEDATNYYARMIELREELDKVKEELKNKTYDKLKS